VDLWVWGVNDPPVVAELQVEVGPDGSVDGQLQATDPEGDWIFYWITSEPTRGTVTFDPMTGLFTYVANPGDPGPDSFTYTVYDSQTQGNDATVQVLAVAGDK
jgi:large repetitive protein